MDAVTIRELAYRAQSAYEPPIGVQVLHNAAGESRGYLSVEDKSVIVAISGTKSPRDWLVDFGFLKKRVDVKPTPKLVRHHATGGFGAGHSLGGALATMAATEAAMDRRKVELVTLGSPRLVDATGATFIEKLGIDHVRIVHAFDLVPPVPLIGFTHVGKLVHLDSAGRRISAAHTFLKQLIAPVKFLISRLDGEALEDHFIRNYMLPVDQFFSLKGGNP
jgi:hypothetical protein